MTRLGIEAEALIMVSVFLCVGFYFIFLRLYRLPHGIPTPPVSSFFVAQILAAFSLGIVAALLAAFFTQNIRIGFCAFLFVASLVLLKAKRVPQTAFVEQSPITLYTLTVLLAAFLASSISLFGVPALNVFAIFNASVLSSLTYLLLKARTLTGEELDRLRPPEVIEPILIEPPSRAMLEPPKSPPLEARRSAPPPGVILGEYDED